MLTSRVGQINKHKQQAGFTLVEVLVVLLIFGIMSGVVALNLPSRKNPLYELGTQIASNLERAAQSSLVNRQTLGVKFSNTGYEVVKYTDGQWQEVQAFEFEEGFLPTITLKKNGTLINLDNPKVQALPIIVFDTTGLATPFNLTLESERTRVHLSGNYMGEIFIKHGELGHE